MRSHWGFKALILFHKIAVVDSISYFIFWTRIRFQIMCNRYFCQICVINTINLKSIYLIEDIAKSDQNQNSKTYLNVTLCSSKTLFLEKFLMASVTAGPLDLILLGLSRTPILTSRQLTEIKIQHTRHNAIDRNSRKKVGVHIIPVNVCVSSHQHRSMVKFC